MTIRVLGVSGRKKFGTDWLDSLERGLDFGDELELRLLLAAEPGTKFGVEYLATEAQQKAGAGTRFWRKLIRRIGLSGRLLKPELSHKDRLAQACAEWAEPVELARWADVVVAIDDSACLGVWELAQRVPEKIYVNRVGQVRNGLIGAGIAAPKPSNRWLSTFPDAGRIGPIEHKPSRLLIAPANYAGQAHAWVAAVNRFVPEAAAQNLKENRLKGSYGNDLVVDRARFQADLDWRNYWREHVFSAYTHVIVEAGLPVLGSTAMPLPEAVAQLRAGGLKVAMLAHGSDARIPSVHSANERWAQYDGMDPAWVRNLEFVSRRNVAAYNSDSESVFLSTPGLLEFVPNGTWLPLVIDVEKWRSDSPVLAESLPVVVHAPSSKQKGSHHIDPILAALQEEGLIEYRRVEGVPVDQMPQVYGTADLVVDQFGAADYGVAACEAMAAGRVVVSLISDHVREHISGHAGLELPIVQADPETLREVIIGLLANREQARSIGRASREFVETVHDGRLAAQVLADWLAK
ncbi:MAG TPA: hypothetical protein PLQ19_07045 [Aeromicrobium sp.]|nr:hypothetical protein [Aeromicrobium sp.]